MVMKSERTGNKLVEMFEASLGETPKLEEQLVLSYFKKNIEGLPVNAGCPDGFCKAFRTRAICQYGWQDIVVWALITSGACDKIWNVLEEFYD